MTTKTEEKRIKTQQVCETICSNFNVLDQYDEDGGRICFTIQFEGNTFDLQWQRGTKYVDCYQSVYGNKNRDKARELENSIEVLISHLV